MEKAGDRVLPVLFDDLSLDLCHSSATKYIVSELSKLHAVGVAHIESWTTASHTD